MCDLCGLEYENIHSHSMYSNIYTPDSIISKEDIAIRAKELGHQTLSLVEHGYISSVFDTYEISKKYDLKLIFGSEFYYVKDRTQKDKTNAHLLLMAKTEQGMTDLKKMISESNKTGFYMKPRIDEDLLFNLDPEHVIVTTACIASPINKYEGYADEFISKCKSHFGDNFFLEVQPHTNIKQVEFNRKLQTYRKQYDVPFILGVDSHYIYPEDAKNRDLFIKGKNIHYPDEDGFIIDFPSTEDIVSRLHQQAVLTDEEIAESFNNTLIARDFDAVKIDDEIKNVTLYPDLSHEEKAKKLKEKITKAWIEDRKHIDKDKWEDYLEAIRLETNIVIDTKMEDYFLLNQKIIEKATKEYGGVLTRTGRGSAPSFYINKLLGFTEIDRLEAPIQLYPTRFMSKSRILETRSLPDVDFNTSDSDPFIKATKDILGEDNVYLMVAYGKMKESESFRNYCRALDLPMNEFNPIGKDLDSYKNHPKWGKIIEESQIFMNVIDSVSPHPCAVVLLNDSVSKDLGVIKVGEEFVALVDSGNSDKYKYLKNDYLTVTVWDIIAKVYDKIGMPIDDVRTLINKTDGDENVWGLYEKGLVSTLNQAGTDSGKPQIMRYKPKSIRELSGWVSAIRPAFASMKEYFLGRKPFKYDSKELNKILESSDNFILYQENIMAVLQYVGFPEDETYGLLKAIAKKKEGIIEPIYQKFIDGFIEKTGSEENAEKVWKIVEDAVGYGFNSSHAYSVGVDSLYGAYLKANFPLDYYSVVLNIYESNTKKTSEIYKELEEFKITVKNIEFGKSQSEYTSEKETNTIYKGMASIKFLNRKIADELYDLYKNKKYENKDYIQLFMDVMESTSVNSRQMNILINLNFFKEFGDSSILNKVWEVMTDKEKPEKEFFDFLGIEKLAVKYSKGHKEKTKNERIENIKKYKDFVEKYPPNKKSVYEQIKFETDNLGYAITTYPDISPRYVLALDINQKYTPVVDAYRLNDGEILKVKVSKRKFYNVDGEMSFNKGNLLKVNRSHKEFGKMKVDGKWLENKNVIWVFLDDYDIVQ